MTGSTPGRIVGIDYGLKRIGIAVSDTSKIISSPRPTIAAKRKAEQTVITIAEELATIEKETGSAVEQVVVGLPLKMSGQSSHLTDEVVHFVELLSAAIDIPVKTWDERLTSVQADRSLQEANLTRKRRSKMIDSVAAVIILQSYLESLPPTGAL